METVRQCETGLPEAYASTLKTWQDLDAGTAMLLKGKANTAELIPALNAHTATLPRFVESYVGEDAQVYNVIEAHRILAGLYEKRLFDSIVTRGFDVKEFVITCRTDIEDHAEALQAKAYDEETPLQQLAADSLFNRFSEALLVNLNAFARCCNEERRTRRSRNTFSQKLHSPRKTVPYK